MYYTRKLDIAQVVIAVSYTHLDVYKRQELDSIKEYISKNNLEAIIHLHGRIHHKDITPFFDKCNVGFCYIQITAYFNLQPPTKLFEYAASGLYNIATETIATKKYISSDNGAVS